MRAFSRYVKTFESFFAEAVGSDAIGVGEHENTDGACDEMVRWHFVVAVKFTYFATPST